MKEKNIIRLIMLISIPTAVICILMPLTEFTGITYEEAEFIIEKLDYPQWPTRLSIEISDFIDNETTVYINNTGDVDSYRPKVKIQYPKGLEFWIFPLGYGGRLSYKFDGEHNYLTSDNGVELKERLHPGESWVFDLQAKGNGNGTCKLIAIEEVLGGWGYSGNCMYGEITHIDIEEIKVDEIEFEVRMT